MKNLILSSPLDGQLIPLNEVNDPVFAGGAMGRGAAVKNPKGKVYAPFDGEISVFFDTHHAIGLHSNDGVDLLIHVGMDTVTLKGKHFTPKAKQGDKVKKGQLLIEFDIAAIKAANHPIITPVIVTNSASYKEIKPVTGSTIKQGDNLIDTVL